MDPGPKAGFFLPRYPWPRSPYICTYGPICYPQPHMTNELQPFVHDALAKGATRDEIRSALKSADWQDDEIDGALRSYADVKFVVPVPRRKPYLSAREAFMYLVMFVCLYISAFNLGALLFD